VLPGRAHRLGGPSVFLWRGMLLTNLNKTRLSSFRETSSVSSRLMNPFLSQDHLLTGCVYSRVLWFLVLRRCGWEHLQPAAGDRFIFWWLGARKRVPKARRQAFDSLSFLVSRRVWLRRNHQVFRGSVVHPDCLVEVV
jgi:hypothetical protein